MTVLYCAPELLVFQRYSKKLDIWAFGCILYEVCCAPIPRKAFTTLEAITAYYFNEDLSPPQIVWEKLGGNREEIPEKYKIHQTAVEKRWDGLNILFASIFRRNPEERPTVMELRENLERIITGEVPNLSDYRPMVRV